MWHLLQGAIIVIVFAQLYPDKTHNPVAASIVGGAAAFAVTWLLLWLKGIKGRLRWW
jgi:hypothetical protein